MLAVARSKCRLPRCLASRRCFASDLPVVDISPFLGGGSSSSRQSTAEALDRACREPGFFYLEGHGVPQGELHRLHSLAQQFFALPAADKEAIALSSCPSAGRGYQRLGENVTKSSRDWHEAIDFYAEPRPGSLDLQALEGQQQGMKMEKVRLFVEGKNLWPQEPKDFRGATERHFAHMSRVGDALMEAMAKALGLPEGCFQGLTDSSFWCARVIGYPPLPASEPGLSCGEHTDYGCWTILAQDETPGALEVRLADGSWRSVEPRAGAFVVNLGDMLSVWTQGHYIATPHRVRQTKGSFRTSIAYFHEPNFDALIQPLKLGPSSVQRRSVEGSTAPLARALDGGSLVYGDHLFAKVSSNFAFSE